MSFMPPMMGDRSARLRLMPLLCVLALVAMVVRGVIPSGYMLAAAEQPGQFVQIIVCHGDGSGFSPALLDLETGEYVDPDQQQDPSDTGKNTPCPCAVTAHYALPDLAGPLSGPFQADIPYRRTLVAIAPGRGLAAPPPPARGPPLTI